MAAEGFHESIQDLTPSTRDMHRAIRSLMEELEAIDWYQQRVDAAQDSELKAILAHNRDEEKEHAAMVLEWIRRQDSIFDEQLRKYLFTSVPIVQHEELAKEAGIVAAGAAPGIGSLRGQAAATDKGVTR
jgi:ferritin-like protein